MYCHHCGKYINEHAIEAKSSSYNLTDESNDNTTVQYVCPQCGHLIKSNLDASEIKSLSRASHAQMQRSRNLFANGMGFAVIGVIIFVIATIFFILARKPSNQFKLTLCAELYISIILAVICLSFLVLGIINLVKAFIKKRCYSKLLDEINDGIFVQ